ncbi:MAG: hypothetical protein AB7H93_07995 [Vicinamibacterales bacterium]
MMMRVVPAICAAVVLLLVPPASAQVLGTFRWRLAPYCNQLSLRIEQKGTVFEVSGTDDQCGGAVAAAANGSAHLNPNGTVGLSVVVIRPDGIPIATSASISPSTLSGSWSDEYGNGGAFTFNPAAAPGSPRRVTLTGGYVVTFTAAASIDAHTTPIAFGRRVPGGVAVVVLRVGQTATPQCPGDVFNPLAAPGTLCVYESVTQNAATVTLANGEAQLTRSDSSGATLVVVPTAAGAVGSAGRWAVTLP